MHLQRHFWKFQFSVKSNWRAHYFQQRLSNKRHAATNKPTVITLRFMSLIVREYSRYKKLGKLNLWLCDLLRTEFTVSNPAFMKTRFEILNSICFGQEVSGCLVVPEQACYSFYQPVETKG